MSFLLTGLLHLLGPIVPLLPFDDDVAPSELGAASHSTAPVVPPAAAPSPSSVLPQEEPPPSLEVQGTRFKLPPSQQDAAAHDPPVASRQAPVKAIKHVPPPTAARQPFWARATAVLRVALAQFEAVFGPQPQPQPQPVSNTYASNPHGLRQRPPLHGPSLTDALVAQGSHGGPRGVAANRRRQAAAEEASRSRWLRLTSRVGIKSRDGAGRSGLSEVLPSPRRSNGANRQRQPATAAAAAAGRSSSAQKENKAPVERVASRRAASVAARRAAVTAAAALNKAGREGKGARVAATERGGASVHVKTLPGRVREPAASQPPPRGATGTPSRAGGRHAHFARLLGRKPVEIVDVDEAPRHTYVSTVTPPPSIYHHHPRAAMGNRAAMGAGGRRLSRRQRRSVDLIIVSATVLPCLDE